MAKFIFKMENILAVKRKLEEREKENYAIALARLRQAEEELERLKRRQSEYEEKLQELMYAVLDIPKIRQTERALDNIKKSVAWQQKVVESEEKNVEVARIRMTEAMKERKTYEKLKENEFEKFLAEINKQEQKEIDELVSYKHGSGEKDEE